MQSDVLLWLTNRVSARLLAKYETFDAAAAPLDWDGWAGQLDMDWRISQRATLYATAQYFDRDIITNHSDAPGGRDVVRDDALNRIGFSFALPVTGTTLQTGLQFQLASNLSADLRLQHVDAAPDNDVPYKQSSAALHGVYRF